MDLGDLITLYRKEAGLTIDELSKKSGVPKGTLNKIIGGVTKAPTLDNMKAIARALGKRLADFDDEAYYKSNEPCASKEQKIIKKYRTLDEYGKKAVDSVLDIEHKRCTETPVVPSAEVIELPYLFQPASAGTGQIADDEASERISVLRNAWTSKADYVLRVSGNSMEPDIHDGDLVLVRSQPGVHLGQIGIFLHENQRYIKVYREDCLESINPECKNILPNESTRCIAWVIGVLKAEWIVKYNFYTDCLILTDTPEVDKIKKSRLGLLPQKQDS